MLRKLGCYPETFLYSKKRRTRNINSVAAGRHGQVFVGCTTPRCTFQIAVKKSKEDMSKEYRIMKRAHSLVPKHVVTPYFFKKCKGGSIMYTEYFPQGTFYSNKSKITLDMMFQILWTLYVFQRHGIRHNDMHMKNIFIDKKRAVISDFGLANESKSYYTTNYGIHKKSDLRYDYHFFLNSLYELHIPRINSVIRRILPPEYLGYESPKVYNFRLRYGVSHNRLPSLASILRNTNNNISSY